jgi:CubicO group peptidase (beta-lactamase class C family)
MALLNAYALDRMHAVLQQQHEAGRLPGAVVLIGTGGQVAHQRAIGQRDPATAAPMAMDAIFRIYSMTKPIVSLTALMLAEEGRLSLADPITRYLPQFSETAVGVERNGALVLERALRPPTVQDLLRHTAAFSYGFLGDSAVHKQYQAAELTDRRRSNQAFCHTLARLPYIGQPGSAWHYSHATDVLGALLEVVSGQPLGTLLQQRVFGPLGMVDTGFSVPPAQQHRLAQPYAHCPDSGQPVQMLDVVNAPVWESGGGGLVSTAADYLRFLQLLHHQGRHAGERLVSRQTIAWMTADHLGSIPVRGELLPPGHGFGLGVAVRTATGLGPQPGSAGQFFWSGIGGTFFFIDPAEDLFALWLAQTPNQRIHFRNLFRHLVYAAVE